MAPELSRLIRRLTFLLLVLPSAAIEVAAVETRSLPVSAGFAIIWVALAAGLGWLVPAPKGDRLVPPRSVFVILIALAAAPSLVEPLRRMWTNDGYPLELQMVFGLRNLGLGLAAFSCWLLCLRLACVVSLFLMLFAISLTDHPAVLIFLGLYIATGSVWLMLVYWTGLRRFFVAAETAVTLEVRPAQDRLPWVTVCAVVALVSCVLGLVAVGPQRAARVLAEWLPTSGGTGAYDPFARGGVNDGPDEVKGDDANSTGTIQSDTFLDSPLPSLYDMFNDMYGEPFKPKEREHSIALDNQSKVNESKRVPSDNQRPNREFPTTRKSPRHPRESSDRAARALFEVQGRTPLHVRVMAYDEFDGISWRETQDNKYPRALERERNSCWMHVQPQNPLPIFSEAEQHQLKITSPGGSLVPTAPQLVRFRVGRVNKVDFFALGTDCILRMAHRNTPSGIVVETESRVVDTRRLDSVEFLVSGSGFESRHTKLPKSFNPEIQALARHWAGDRPKGWAQIVEVLQRLRREYCVDPTTRVPDDCLDPIGFFLFDARRGPDYQFASAAALLLRSLGYRTRLVSGFYVSPEHYDPVTRHTPVVSEDLHFWAEVMLPFSDWLIIEPTPGYDVLGPHLSWSELLWAGAVAAAQWAWRHVVALSLSMAFLGAFWWWRRELLDAVAVSLWRCFPGQTWRDCISRAVWVMELRGRWTGKARKLSQTVPTWLQCVLQDRSAAHAEVDQLGAMAAWAAYGHDLQPPWQANEVRGVCRRVIDTWTLRRWRAAAAL